MTVQQSDTFNLASLVVNDVYIVVAPPVNTTVQGVDSGIVGLVGGASWGPLNTGVKAGSPAEAARFWGPLVNQPNDLMTDTVICYQNQVTSIVNVRVADGTQAAATANLVTAAFGTVTLAGTFQAGDIVTVTVNGNAVAYTAITGDATVAGVAAKVLAALNANATFALSFFAELTGLIITIKSKSASNATTLTTAVTGTTPTITSTASGATLAGGNVTLLPLNAYYTGTEGNSLRVTAEQGTNYTQAIPTWTIRVSRVGLSPQSEVFPNILESSLKTLLATYLANGQSVSRGPSELLSPGTAGAGSGAPAQTQLSLSGGLNGDTAITKAQLLGTNTATPATGMYALDRKGVQQFGLCGMVDSTAWTSMTAFAILIGALVVLPFAASTSTAAAIALKKSAGVDTPYAVLVKDWIQFFDSANDALRLVSPMPFALGKIASLNPRESPGNKPIVGPTATERTIAKQDYTTSELADLHRYGIMIITNDLPGGTFFGLRHGLNTSTNNATNGVEYTRMTNFIAYSLNGAFGAVIDQVQSAQPNDPLRASVEKKLRNFFLGLKSPDVRMIDDFSVDMAFGPGKINTAESVGAGFMKAKVMVKYLSIVRFFVVQLTGGKTVEVSIS